MANQRSYYKEISQSRQLFRRTEIVAEKVYLRTIDRKLIVMVIFNSFTDISFLKDFPNAFFLSLTVFRKKYEIILRYSFQELCLYILSGKGVNQLQLLLITTFGNIQRYLHITYSTEAGLFKCIPKNSSCGNKQTFQNNI